MQSILSQEKCFAALNGEVSIYAPLIEAEKTKMVAKAKNVIILCLKDKVIREIVRNKIAASIYTKI